MKIIGLLVFLLAALWGLVAYSRDTSVSVPGGGRVHNIGLLEERRSDLMLSGVGALAGILLFGFGSLQARKNVEVAEIRKCPACAELIQKEAGICRFCGREVQKAQITGLRIDGLTPNGNGAKSGLRIGDVLIGYGDHTVSRQSELEEAIAGNAKYDAEISVLRNGQVVNVRSAYGALEVSLSEVQLAGKSGN